MLALGGRADPPGLGQTLDGVWRFHAGDSPAWAAPDLDDRQWDVIDLVSDPHTLDSDVGIPGYLDGWRARGHPQLEGYGWYRRQVTLPPQGDLVMLGPPSVDDGYEMYWNGRPVGGIGRLSGTPKVNSTRPMLAPLPTSPGERSGVLAVRAFMQPGVDRDQSSGGLRTVPVLASRADGERLYRAEWHRTIAGYVVDAVEPAAMLVLAIIVLLTGAGRSFSRWAALALVTSGCLRLGNAISAWSDLLSLPALLWLSGVIFAPLAKFAWAMTWNHWEEGRDRRFVSILSVAAWLIMIAGALAKSEFMSEIGRALIALLLIAIVVRIARRGENKLLVLMAMVLTTVSLFASDLSALGVPSIWFPFHIGVSRSQYAYALALPLLAYVLTIARRSRDPATRAIVSDAAT